MTKYVSYVFAHYTLHTVLHGMCGLCIIGTHTFIKYIYSVYQTCSKNGIYGFKFTCYREVPTKRFGVLSNNMSHKTVFPHHTHTQKKLNDTHTKKIMASLLNTSVAWIALRGQAPLENQPALSTLVSNNLV